MVGMRDTILHRQKMHIEIDLPVCYNIIKSTQTNLIKIGRTIDKC